MSNVTEPDVLRANCLPNACFHVHGKGITFSGKAQDKYMEAFGSYSSVW